MTQQINKLRIYHVTSDGVKREIKRNAVDYGSTVMVQYVDNDDVAIVPKSELKADTRRATGGSHDREQEL